MATNLAGGIALSQLGACVVRMARLDSDCSPTGGTNGGIVTAAIATLTADPDIEEGTVYEPKTACGSIYFTYERPDRIKRVNISGELLVFDWEAMAMMFGGDLILGRAAGSFSGKAIGHAAPNYSAAATNGVYLEIISTAIVPGSGDCITSGTSTVAIGHIFGKVKIVKGSRTFEDDVARLTFSGKATNNPNLFDGPWNDFPGAGYIPNSPWIEVGYSQTEYDAIVAAIAPGYVNLPAGS